MRVYDRQNLDVPVLGQCQRIRGRRHRRCPKPARQVVRYTLPRRQIFRDADGYPVYRVIETPFAWEACNSCGNRAQRHGAACLLKIR